MAWSRNIIIAFGLAVALASTAVARPESGVRAELYFPSRERGLAKEIRTLPAPKDHRELARALFAALARGPEDKKLLPSLPPGVGLRSLFILPGGLVVLDLEGEQLRSHASGGLMEKNATRSLAMTIFSNLPAATGLKILVDGNEAETLWGHIDIEDPLTVEDFSSGTTP